MLFLTIVKKFTKTFNYYKHLIILLGGIVMQENTFGKVFAFVIIGLLIVVSMIPYITGKERISNISINCTNSYNIEPNICTYTPNKDWTKTFGGSYWSHTYGGSSYDEGYAVQLTDDRGYIIAGATVSFGAGDWDVWLIKTDSNGNEEWNSTFGGISYDRGYSVQQTDDDRYIIAGYTVSYNSDGTGCDVWLIKTDSNGNEEWNSTFGGTGIPNKFDMGYDVQQTDDGGFIIAGDTEIYYVSMSDVLLIKTDSSGNEVWTKTFGGSAADRGRSVQQTFDGGYIIAGWAVSFIGPDPDVWLIKTDTNGDEEWNSIYGYEENSGEWGYAVQQTIDGGYVIAGATMSAVLMRNGSKSSNKEEGTDVWLIKTISDGNSFFQITNLTSNWNLISLPFNQTVDKINITIHHFNNNYTWSEAVSNGYISDFIFNWNRSSQSYIFTYSLDQGYGYWFYAYEPCELWAHNIILVSDDYITDIENGWNIVSLPYDSPVDKTDILVDSVPWITAVDNGWISDYVFGWSRTGQGYIFSDTLMPGYAYWLYAYQPCTLKRVV